MNILRTININLINFFEVTLMCEEKSNKLDNIEKELIVSEFNQRYNQYRWEDETRAKFINFYIIIYLAFYALIRYLFDNTEFMKLFPYSAFPNVQYAIIFLFFAIIGTFWIISIVSFRSIQLLEGRTIKDIKELFSPHLINNVRYPIDRRIWKTNKLVYSTSPLTFAIFLLNEVVFIISYYFFNLSGVPDYKNVTIYINALSIILIIIFARFWRPSESSLKTLDYEKIW